MLVKTNQSLKDLNAFHVDVSAKNLAKIKSEKDLSELLSDKKYKPMSKCILGESSGTLFTKDFDGLVIKIELKGIKLVTQTEKHVQVEVSSGESWDDLVLWVIDYNFQGIENMSGIPGSVGAAAVQNIAAYGQDFAEIFVSLHAIEVSTGKLKKFTKDDLKFKYRDSIFKDKLADKYIITKVLIQLNKVVKVDTSYHSRYESIEAELAKSSKKPHSLMDVRKAVLKIRSIKFPDWKVHGNSGSFFKNPIISKNKLLKIQKKYPDVQYYPTHKMLYPKMRDEKLIKSEKVKLAAAWLLDELGWRGKRTGKVGTSRNQALVIVNYGDATPDEILEFAEKMNKDFKKNFGVRLEPEVRIV